jgi:hypothetical protein
MSHAKDFVPGSSMKRYAICQGFMTFGRPCDLLRLQPPTFETCPRHLVHRTVQKSFCPRTYCPERHQVHECFIWVWYVQAEPQHLVGSMLLNSRSRGKRAPRQGQSPTTVFGHGHGQGRPGVWWLVGGIKWGGQHAKIQTCRGQSISHAKPKVPAV